MEIIGRKKFVRMLKELSNKTKTPVWEALQKGADETVEFSKTLVAVDKGSLKNSFEMTSYWKDTTASFGVEWRVGDYKGIWLEYGVQAGEKVVKVRGRKDGRLKVVTWGDKTPQPFFWPAYRTMRPRIIRRVSKAQREMLKKHWKL